MKLTGGQSIAGEVDKLFTLVHAFPGRGKSSFLCSLPSPLSIVNLDRSIKPIIEMLPPHYEIDYDFVAQDPDNAQKQMAMHVLHMVDSAVNKAIARGTGSFCLDGADILWEYVKLAKLPDGDVPPKAYADANTWFNSLNRRLGMSPLQVCMTVGSKYKWEGMQKETRKVQPEGFKWMEKYITHEVYMYFPNELDTPYDVPSGAAQPQQHMAYFGVSKINESLAGTVVPNLSFKRMWRMVYGVPFPQEELLYVPGKASTTQTD